jgi:hypothetical protein
MISGSMSDSREQPRLQFSLMTLFVITTLICIILAILKTWPERGFVGVVLALALFERIYRRQIKAVVGLQTYATTAAILERTFAVVAGTMVGGLLGLITAILMFNIFGSHPGILLSLKVGAASGAVLGLIYPRFTIHVIDLLPIP